MKTTMTAKLKLHDRRESRFKHCARHNWRIVMALNYASRYAFEHGKMSKSAALQDGTYD